MGIRTVTQWRVALGDSIRAVRELAGWSQSRAAEALRWSRTTIVAIEGGKQAVSGDQLFLMAELYRVHVAELLPGHVARYGRPSY